MTQPFRYDSRLQRDEIRLLSAALSDDDSTLRFNLTSTTLATPTPYIALSYVWGSPDNPISIQVDNRPFSITRNLYAALIHLAPELRDEGLPLWADMVCINQSDEVEKLSQIKQMSQIYRSATKVIAFLGESDGQTDQAVEQLKAVGQAVLHAGAMTITEEDMARWPDFEHLASRPDEQRSKTEMRIQIDKIASAQSGGVFTRSKIATGAALALFHRPWFTRAWVIQELAMAPKNGCFFAVGDKRIPWEHLWAGHLLLAIWLMREARAIGKSSSMMGKLFRLGLFVARTGTIPRAFSSRAAQTLGIRKKYLQNNLKLALHSLVVTLYVGDSGTPLGCRDPEDKILALASLSQNSDKAFLEGVLTPGISWQQVYTSVAKRFYEQGQIHFLSLCRQRSPTLPSWVPDWSHHQRLPWLGFNTHDATQLFDAGKGTGIEVSFPNDRTLRLTGYTVDTIQEVGSEWTCHLDEDFNWESARIRIEELDRFLSLSRRYTGQARSDARWRIITADREASKLEQPRRATKEISKVAFSGLEKIAKSASPTDGTFAKWYQSYRNILMSLYKSRPFISDKGYVGLCPETVKQGDAVFIPSGGHCPYAIRKSDVPGTVPVSLSSPSVKNEVSGRTWVLLGEVYVHGIMDGELDLGTCAEVEQFDLI